MQLTIEQKAVFDLIKAHFHRPLYPLAAALPLTKRLLEFQTLEIYLPRRWGKSTLCQHIHTMLGGELYTRNVTMANMHRYLYGSMDQLEMRAESLRGKRTNSKVNLMIFDEVQVFRDKRVQQALTSLTHSGALADNFKVVSLATPVL